METATTTMHIEKWVEGDGIIYIDIVSNGLPGISWINYFSATDSISIFGKMALRSPDFGYTKNITTKIAIIKGQRLINEERDTEVLIEKVKLLGYVQPRPETGCLLGKMLSKDDLQKMKLEAIVPMHVPLLCLDGISRLVYTTRHTGKQNYISACYIRNKELWPEKYGFAFEVK